MPLLVGLGFRTLSSSPGATPFVKDCIRHINVSECEELARRAIRMKTGGDVRHEVTEHRKHWRGRADEMCSDA